MIFVLFLLSFKDVVGLLFYSSLKVQNLAPFSPSLPKQLSFCGFCCPWHQLFWIGQTSSKFGQCLLVTKNSRLSALSYFYFESQKIEKHAWGESRDEPSQSLLLFFMKLHNSTFSIAALGSEVRKMTAHGLQELVGDLSQSELETPTNSKQFSFPIRPFSI